MTLIADWAERPHPMDAAASLAQAHRRFVEEPGLAALAVVEGDRPVGLLDRTIVLDSGASDAPCSALMSRPRVLPCETSAEAALAAVLGDGCLPLVMTRQGRYHGLITERSLLAALSGARRPDAPARVEDGGRFVEMLGREIRTPLSGVLAVAELLQRQPLTADAQAYVQTIVDSSESLLRQVDDAFDLAMGESGRLEIKPGPVQLRAFVDDIQAQWHSRRAGGVPVLIAFDGDPDLGVQADGARLRQVFDTLISAAVKSTRQGAVEASLKTRVSGTDVHLEGRVRDSGPGLAPEHLARIFEPVSQAGAGARAGWSGLGPALCRRIVEALGGSIRAESNVGDGVTVTFELVVPRLEILAEPGPSSGRVSGRAVHVLVVDDNATNRMVAEGLCEMFDCTSECAEDGVEALEAARSGRFDLILMDIKMPRMDGMEATRAIRGLPGPAGQVPIIALTANADPDDAKTYIASGMCSVVEKPIKPERLLACMNAALSERGRAIKAA